MIRRFRRVVLLFSLLGLLITPGMDRAIAQVGGEIDAVATGVTGTGGGPTDLTHLRRESQFNGISLHFTARRDDRAVDCRVTTGPAGIGFRARENAAEGRGFINVQDDIARGDGTLIHPLDANDGEVVHCEVSSTGEGQFHRVGTAVVVRFEIAVRAERRDGNLVFEHTYCLRVVASAVPAPPNFTQAAITAAGAGTAGPCEPEKLAGRTAADQNEHG